MHTSVYNCQAKLIFKLSLVYNTLTMQFFFFQVMHVLFYNLKIVSRNSFIKNPCRFIISSSYFKQLLKRILCSKYKYIKKWRKKRKKIKKEMSKTIAERKLNMVFVFKSARENTRSVCECPIDQWTLTIVLSTISQKKSSVNENGPE